MSKFLFYLAVIVAMFIATAVCHHYDISPHWIAIAASWWVAIPIFCGFAALMIAIVVQLKD